MSLVLSPTILPEYRRVGHELGTQHAELDDVFEPVLALVSDDPADDVFLAAALASHTRLILSGDKDLLWGSG